MYSAFTINLLGYNRDPEIKEEWDPFKTGKRRNVFTWTIKDLPALREEPYITNLNDYRAKLYFQLTGYWDQYIKQTFSKTWKEVSENIAKIYDPLVEEEDTFDFVNGLLAKAQTDQENYLCYTIMFGARS